MPTHTATFRLFAGLAAAFAAGLAAGQTQALPNSVTTGKSDPGTGAVRAEKPDIERFLKIRTPGAPQILPDNSMIVRDWPDGIFQLYRVTEARVRPDSPRQKLTDFRDGVGGFTLSPDRTRILLTAAVGGNENFQIYHMPADARGPGDITPVASDPAVQFAINCWLRDSSGFIYSGNADPKAPNDFHLYRHVFGKGTERILAREGSWSASDAAAAGDRVLVEQYRSISDSSIYELDVKSGSLSDLSPKSSDAPTTANNLVGYMPGDKAVLYTSDVEEGRMRLFRRDLATGEVSKPLPALDKYEIDGASMNPEKTLLAVVTNEDGYGVLHIYSLNDFSEYKGLEIEPGVVGLASFRGRQVIYSLSNARTPGLAFEWSVPLRHTEQENNPPAPRQITVADDQGIDLRAFPLPELVRYKSFDGVEIPAFLYLPPGHTKGTPIPFAIQYHGGPEGQHRPVFNATIQYLLSEGFGVMLPNVRGSVGYGRAFHMMDDYKKRWDSVRDGVDAAKWLVENGYAKPGKIATWGGSYGGYMSVACLVEDGERTERGEQKERYFGAGVNIVGIVNLKTFLEKTSGYRRKLREVEYGPLSDPEFLLSVSPLNRMEAIRVPVFFAHGFNDPRVPVEEATQLAIALKDRALKERKMDQMPGLLVFPDEGHGFAKLDNRLLFTRRMADFLKRTIGN